MSDFFEAATSVLRTAEARLDVAAQNVANMSTPGYRRRTVSFDSLLQSGLQAPSIRLDLSEGELRPTGAPLDLAIFGEGTFALRSGETIVYTRNGQFHRDADGRVVDAEGRALQQDAGGDLILRGPDFEIHRDGVVTEGDTPVGRISVRRFIDPAQIAAGANGVLEAAPANVEAASSAEVRQGFLESSNVSLGHEMLEVMKTVRGAGSSQKLVNIYDDLLSRAITSFGQS